MHTYFVGVRFSVIRTAEALAVPMHNSGRAGRKEWQAVACSCCTGTAGWQRVCLGAGGRGCLLALLPSQKPASKLPAISCMHACLSWGLFFNVFQQTFRNFLLQDCKQKRAAMKRFRCSSVCWLAFFFFAFTCCFIHYAAVFVTPAWCLRESLRLICLLMWFKLSWHSLKHFYDFLSHLIHMEIVCLK